MKKYLITIVAVALFLACVVLTFGKITKEEKRSGQEIVIKENNTLSIIYIGDYKGGKEILEKSTIKEIAPCDDTPGAYTFFVEQENF